MFQGMDTTGSTYIEQMFHVEWALNTVIFCSYKTVIIGGKESYPKQRLVTICRWQMAGADMWTLNILHKIPQYQDVYSYCKIEKFRRVVLQREAYVQWINAPVCFVILHQFNVRFFNYLQLCNVVQQQLALMYNSNLHSCRTAVCTDVQHQFALRYNSSLHWCTTAACTEVQQQIALMYNSSLHWCTTPVCTKIQQRSALWQCSLAVWYWSCLQCCITIVWTVHITASLCNVIHTSPVPVENALTNCSVIFWQLSAYCSVHMIIDINY